MAKIDVLKVAIIGGGNIAWHHLPVLVDLPQVEVTALVDTNAKT